jgi:hypothetical protein
MATARSSAEYGARDAARDRTAAMLQAALAQANVPAMPTTRDHARAARP